MTNSLCCNQRAHTLSWVFLPGKILAMKIQKKKKKKSPTVLTGGGEKQQAQSSPFLFYNKSLFNLRDKILHHRAIRKLSHLGKEISFPLHSFLVLVFHSAGRGKVNRDRASRKCLGNLVQGRWEIATHLEEGQKHL